MSIFTNPASRSREEASAYTSAVLGLLGEADPMEVLKETPAALRRLLASIPAHVSGIPESPGKWSIRHVLRHLADSELVWGWRLRSVLAQDRAPITGYDQDAWAERLGYGEADPGESVGEFEVLRRSNLRLLGRATGDDLRRVGVHSERGEESVAHMMRLYAGHDLLHLRQIERIRTAVTEVG